MKKKSPWKAIAIITAIVGAVVAVASYLKRKSQKISEELDFDNSMYFEDDSSMTYDDEEDHSDTEASAMEVDDASEEAVGVSESEEIDKNGE
jgi:hypothetical protein